MTTETPSHNRTAHEPEVERGERDGRTCRRLGQPFPRLHGGAYAVGFLYGYAAEGRRLSAT